jgi:prevent-host-death family protein
MPLMEVRDTLGQRVDAAHFADEATVITKNGHPRAVLISYEHYLALVDKLKESA